MGINRDLSLFKIERTISSDVWSACSWVKESHLLLTIRRKHLLPEIRAAIDYVWVIVPCNKQKLVLSLKSVLLHTGWLLPITGILVMYQCLKIYTSIALLFFYKIGLIIFHKSLFN
jgi:hypothetical protein